MPTAIVSFSASADFNGDKHRALVETPPQSWQFSRVNLDRWDFQHSLITEGDNAIAVGGLIKGVLSLKFPGVPQSAFFQASPVIELTLRDVLGREYSLSLVTSPARRNFYYPVVPMGAGAPQAQAPPSPIAPPSQPQPQAGR
jgi:hypothetical protein